MSRTHWKQLQNNDWIGAYALQDGQDLTLTIDKAMQEGYSTAPDNIRALGFGAGMGLPNMKRYTDDMKIESVVGEGTTITMTVLLA